MKLQKNDIIRRLKLTEEAGEHACSLNNQTLKGYGNHWHDYYEIEIIVDGSGTCWYNGVTQTRRKGDITLLTPADFHMMTSDEPFTLINIEFGAQWLSEKMHTMMCSPEFEKVQHLDDEELERLLVAVNLFEKEYKTDGPCIGQLLEYIFSRFVHCKQAAPAKDANKEYMSGIIKAVSYIEHHFRESITLEVLSEVSGYHPSYFSKMFRKVTGEKYIDRLTTLRISYAKMLLKRGVPTSETCFASGFGSVSNFVAVFKKRCGMTPSAYRDSKQPNKKP